MRRSRRVVLGLACLASSALAVAFLFVHRPFGVGDAGTVLRTYEARTGSVFLPLPADPFQAPLVRQLDVPSFAGARSVWGSTGRDDSGHIWIGVSAGSPGTSAHLVRYDPNSDTWRDLGSVVDQLANEGSHRDGAGQVKIHSKIIPADDGLLYFASMDEDGENASSNALPRGGSHLWRIDPRTDRWQHLMSAPEGLIAVAGVGRYIYALGYWNHILYQYDTRTGRSKRVVVGSASGHVSRNVIADARGHAYAPRVAVQPHGKPTAVLVEYDVELREIGTTTLDLYLGTDSLSANHGVVGLAYLADGRIAFTTHRGHLYLIDPREAGPARVSPVGWFHPDGEAYVPSLFSLSGGTLLAGVSQRAGRHQWVINDLATGISAAFPLDTKGLRNVLLYGSISRDNAGRFYVGGWAAGTAGGERPLLLQISAAP